MNVRRGGAQRYPYLFCSAVFHCIVEGLLKDPEQAEGEFSGQCGRYVLTVAGDLTLEPLGELPADALHGGDEAYNLQPCGLQIVREGPNLSRSVGDGCLDFVDLTMDFHRQWQAVAKLIQSYYG